MNMKLTNGLLGLGALLIASQVNAATVSLTPAATDAALGDTFALDIVGTDFAAGATGGGVHLTWDANVLELVPGSATLATDVPDSTGTGGPYEWSALSGSTSAGVLDISAYFANTDIFGNQFPVSAANFDFLSLSFTVISVDTIDVTFGISDSIDGGPWQDGLGEDISSVGLYNTATVTVNAIPVPAAVWLFGSGLIGLVGVARRKSQLA